jgi:4'-phosphopantetheinyl transferase
MLGRMASVEAAPSWASQAGPPELGADEVHVWHFPLVIPPGREADWRAVLSPAERERADKFAFPHLRERYLAAHAIMRRLLGGYLCVDPASLAFEIAERGKPSLPGHPLHFNLSHTNDHGLLAVTRAGAVGVDIESIDRQVDRAGIAGRFFSRAEADELASLPPDLQPEAFCNLWTRKEAWLKATGVGISEGLNQVEFNCRPGEPARLLRIGGDEREAAGWFLHSFRPPGEHLGAVAVRARDVKVRCFEFVDQTR